VSAERRNKRGKKSETARTIAAWPKKQHFGEPRIQASDFFRGLFSRYIKPAFPSGVSIPEGIPKSFSAACSACLGLVLDENKKQTG
jgi:hypothetical protein